MEKAIEKLEHRISDLVRLCEELGRENQTLRNDVQILNQEIKSLQEKNKIARARVEQIVTRLKSLES